MEIFIWLISILIIRFPVNGYPNMLLLQNEAYKNQEDDMLFPDAGALAERGLPRRGRSIPWTNGIVPYEILPGYASTQQLLIIGTMQRMERIIAINNSKCIQFRERNATDPYFITITNGIGCSSYVGQNTGINIARRVTLQHPGCIYEGIIMHELLHVLGFYHEQSRSDRDEYVRINYDNIQPGKEHNFDKYSITAIDTQHTPYDYRSIMHYEAYAFSKNGLSTIEAFLLNITLGQRDYMTEIDIQEVHLMYNCTASDTTFPPTPAVTTANLHMQMILYSSLTTDTDQYSRYSTLESNYYYETYRVIVSQTGSYTFRSNSSIDTYGYFYSSVFHPDHANWNLIAYDDDSAGDEQFQIQMYLRGNFTYELVVTTSKSYTTGSYSITVLGLNSVRIEKIMQSSTSSGTFRISTSILVTFRSSLILLTTEHFIRCAYP